MDNPLSYYYKKLTKKLPFDWTIGSILLSVFSISLLHFYGFILSIPENLRQIVITVFTDIFVGTFYFYLLLSWAASKSMTFVVFSYFYILSNSLKITESETSVKFVKLLELVVQLFFFIVSYIYLYHGFFEGLSKAYYVHLGGNKSVVILLILLTITGMIFALFGKFFSYLNFPFLASNDEKKSNKNLGSSKARPLVMICAGFLLVLAFISGKLRGGSLWLDNPVVIQDGRLAGRFNVVLSNKDSMILIEHLAFYDRYIIATPKAIFYEIVNTADFPRKFKFPWLPPYEEIYENSENVDDKESKP